MKIVTVLLLFCSLSYANTYHSERKAQLNHVEKWVVSAKNMLKNDEMSMFSDNHIEFNQKTRKVFLHAEKLAGKINDYYYQSLAFLLIAEGYTSYYPELPRRFKITEKNRAQLWYPYKDAMRVLDQVLRVSGWLNKISYRNRYGLIGDISFFVHLEYDKIRQAVEPIDPNDSNNFGETSFQERPSRICYARALQAIKKAYQNELYSFESTERKRKKIKRLSPKAYLYKMAWQRFERNGVESSEPPLLYVPSQWPSSLPGLSYQARQNAAVPFSETKAFKFFDFLAEVFIPKYDLAKKVIKLL